MKLLAKPSVRFTLVAGLAVMTDFVLAYTLRTFTDMPLYVCAAITFVIVSSVVYFIHEHWTFRHESSRTSGERLVKNLSVNGAAWFSRVAVIFVLETMREPDNVVLAFFYFGCGACVSFTINFVVNRFWVFRDRH